ncbi:MAG: hypothetical protein PHC54_02885 [Candidatus Omnitrophica bacterium]|nr:hypothetical protein [Candidatus Omnitrophota bacterium]MDD5592180.1 hypothetical protein [Candidatus Omnitrophota bacterium]
MKRQTIITMSITFLLTFCAGILLFAQDLETQDTAMPQKSRGAAIATQQPITAAAEPEVEWLWGEVVSIDTDSKQLLVRCLDYETDTEKVISININEKTTYENAKSLAEIKTQDTLSIDYVAALDGKNIARNISVEKDEGAEQVMLEENKAGAKATPGLE